jgi:hypothetical protein
LSFIPYLLSLIVHPSFTLTRRVTNDIVGA